MFSSWNQDTLRCFCLIIRLVTLATKTKDVSPLCKLSAAFYWEHFLYIISKTHLKKKTAVEFCLELMSTTLSYLAWNFVCFDCYLITTELGVNSCFFFSPPEELKTLMFLFLFFTCSYVHWGWLTYIHKTHIMINFIIV